MTHAFVYFYIIPRWLEEGANMVEERSSYVLR